MQLNAWGTQPDDLDSLGVLDALITVDPINALNKSFTLEKHFTLGKRGGTTHHKRSSFDWRRGEHR